MDADAIGEIFRAFGPVAVRRMFGGAGLYAQGRMFALVSDGVVYLKAGASNDRTPRISSVRDWNPSPTP
ncbi:MAG: TfoX/Sxy family protein [Pseudorhodoplanes sp.]